MAKFLVISPLMQLLSHTLWEDPWRAVPNYVGTDSTRTGMCKAVLRSVSFPCYVLSTPNANHNSIPSWSMISTKISTATTPIHMICVLYRFFDILHMLPAAIALGSMNFKHNLETLPRPFQSSFLTGRRYILYLYLSKAFSEYEK